MHLKSQIPHMSDYWLLLAGQAPSIANQKSKIKNPTPSLNIHSPFIPYPSLAIYQSKNMNPPETDQCAFQRLARLLPADYDRARRAEARLLRIRIETLDSEVAKCRVGLDLEVYAKALRLPGIEPWPEPVDAPELFTEVASRFGLYIFLPSGAPDAFALWTGHAHAFSAFYQSP